MHELTDHSPADLLFQGHERPHGSSEQLQVRLKSRGRVSRCPVRPGRVARIISTHDGCARCPPPPGGQGPCGLPLLRSGVGRRHGARSGPVAGAFHQGVHPDVRRVAPSVPVDPSSRARQRHSFGPPTGRCRGSASPSGSEASDRSPPASGGCSARRPPPTANAWPSAARLVRIPVCVAKTYGRPKNRTFREDDRDVAP